MTGNRRFMTTQVSKLVKHLGENWTGVVGFNEPMSDKPERYGYRGAAKCGGLRVQIVEGGYTATASDDGVGEVPEIADAVVGCTMGTVFKTPEEAIAGALLRWEALILKRIDQYEELCRAAGNKIPYFACNDAARHHISRQAVKMYETVAPKKSKVTY